MAEDAPEYDKRVMKILGMLGEGRDRREVATEELDYSSWKSLDTYMRRRGFRYDSDAGNYVPDVPDNGDVPDGASGREALVISLLDGGMDPRQAAESLGFGDHRELAGFMAEMGYSWSSEEGNYVPEGEGRDDGTDDAEKEPAGAGRGAGPPHRDDDGALEELKGYLPLLRRLSEKEGELVDLLGGDGDGRVPRYAVPGDSTTKSTYMSRRLAALMEEFSERKNLSQREIVECALVEFLRRYGFAEEVESLLDS